MIDSWSLFCRGKPCSRISQTRSSGSPPECKFLRELCSRAAPFFTIHAPWEQIIIQASLYKISIFTGPPPAATVLLLLLFLTRECAFGNPSGRAVRRVEPAQGEQAQKKISRYRRARSWAKSCSSRFLSMINTPLCLGVKTSCLYVLLDRNNCQWCEKNVGKMCAVEVFIRHQNTI